MNKQRRARIDALLGRLADLVPDIEAIRDEEQEALDALPESMQDGDRASTMQNAIDALDGAVQSCEEVDSALNDAKGT